MKKKLSVGKRMLAFVLTFAMVFTAISWGEVGEVKAEVTNLLTDGDMESGNAWNDRITVGGYTYDNVIDSVSVVSEGVHGGQYALQITTKANTDLYLNCSEISGLDENKTYVFSGYAKLASETSNVWVGDGTNNSAWSNNDGWKQFSYEVTESTSYTPRVYAWAPSGTVLLIDDLEFKEKEATSADPVQDVYSVSIEVNSNGAVYIGDTFTLNANIKKNGEPVTDVTPYHIYWWNNTANTDSWFLAYDSKNGQQSVTVDTSAASKGDYEFKVELKDADWNLLAGPVTVSIHIEEKVLEGAVDSELYVPYIEGITDADGFYRGADVSSYLSIKSSGAIYKDKDGNALNDVEFFQLLKNSGVNTVRIRVWNNPFDKDGYGYGGGNNDLGAAITMGKWATEAGLGVLIDFHYSDFWADPGKQQAPKAWSGYSVQEKVTAIHDFTTNSLNALLDAGVNVTMVQVGNETNGKMCGVEGKGNWTTDLDLLFDAGCDAVHEVATAHSRTIKAVVHFTNPESSGKQSGYAANLYAGNVSYDVFATSYYPYWHGSLSNLTSVLSSIATRYNKEVMVAETSWATTLADGDGHENTVRVGSNDQYNPSDKDVKYMYTSQGQANEMASVVNAVKKVGEKGIGVFFWEPIWIPVAYAYNGDGSLNSDILASNKNKWEQYGSGWASSNAAEYDPDDAGKYYGGSAIDNQSWFDFNGKALEGINIFKYLQTGTTADGDAVAQAMDASVEIYAGDTLSLPTQVSVIKVNGKVVSKDATWSNPEVVKNDVQGEYVVNGTVDGVAVNCKVKVLPPNFIKNGGFETYTEFDINDVDAFNPNAFDNWTLSNRNFNTQDIASNNKSGLVGLHFAKKEETDVTATQTVTLNKGKYELSAYVSGGGQDADEVGISITVGGQKYENREGKLNGWKVWEQLKISDIIVTEDNTPVTVCLFVEKANDKVWGAFDDVVLIQTGTVSSQPSQPQPFTPSDGTSSGSSDTQKPDTTVTTNPDGTKTETKTETTTNESGKEVETTVTTQKDADGKVTGSTEVSTIANVAKNTEVTVTVEKGADGKVAEAAAEVTKKGAETKTGTKGTIAGVVVDQIKEAAGTADIAITTSVTDAKGKEKYSVTVNAGDLVAGEKLTVVVKDEKTGKTVLVDAKQVKVTVNGGVNVVLPEGKDYTLIDTKEAEKVTKEILKTVAPVKTSATLKEGKKATAKLSKKLDMDNVKKITYVSSKKSVATVDKNGKVTAKKAGTVIISIKVTLNNGTTKTVKMKYKVK